MPYWSPCVWEQLLEIISHTQKLLLSIKFYNRIEIGDFILKIFFGHRSTYKKYKQEIYKKWIHTNVQEMDSYKHTKNEFIQTYKKWIHTNIQEMDSYKHTRNGFIQTYKKWIRSMQCEHVGCSFLFPYLHHYNLIFAAEQAVCHLRHFTRWPKKVFLFHKASKDSLLFCCLNIFRLWIFIHKGRFLHLSHSNPIKLLEIY